MNIEAENRLRLGIPQQPVEVLADVERAHLDDRHAGAERREVRDRVDRAVRKVEGHAIPALEPLVEQGLGEVARGFPEPAVGPLRPVENERHAVRMLEHRLLDQFHERPVRNVQGRRNSGRIVLQPYPFGGGVDHGTSAADSPLSLYRRQGFGAPASFSNWTPGLYDATQRTRSPIARSPTALTDGIHPLIRPPSSSPTRT